MQGAAVSSSANTWRGMVCVLTEMVRGTRSGARTGGVLRNRLIPSAVMTSPAPRRALQCVECDVVIIRDTAPRLFQPCHVTTFGLRPWEPKPYSL